MSQPPSIPSGALPDPEEEDGGEVDFQAAWRRERAARLRAEEALARERAAALKPPEEIDPRTLALDALRTGTWRWDMATGRITRDARLQALLGLDPSRDAQGGVDWHQFVHPADQDLLRTTLDRASREGSYELDYRILRPDGQVRWVRDRGAVLAGENEAPRYFIGLTTDITEMAQSQEERERFFRLAPDMFCVAGMDGYFRRINAAFSRTLGWSQEELLDRPFFDLVHPEDREATYAEVAKLARGVPTLRFENRYRCKDGGYKWLSWATSPLPALGLLYAAARDITEHKRLEEQARVRADFEQKLIGIVSHDLRNPLSVIHLGATHLLRRGDLDPKVLEIVTRIATSTQRCTRLVRDLLDFTQARLGMGIPITRRAFDLEGLVRQGVEEVGASAPGREFRLSAEGDLRGEWDPDRLAQVVANLLSNAAKYSPTGTPIDVTLRGEQTQVMLEVHNQGDPIPERIQARLFEPMQRGDPGSNNASRSVGLGLYIVKHLVEAHGGSVSACSVEGGGTRFTVWLPRALPPASSPEPLR